MKINIFTPLAPAPTDIAMCVARFAPTLAQSNIVTFFTDAKDVDESLYPGCRIVRYERGNIDWRILNYADLNLYNVGNDARFHAQVTDVAFAHPGVVVLHDACIHELMYATLTRGGRCDERYLALVRKYYPEGMEDSRSFLAGKVPLCDIVAKNPMTKWALEGSIGVITHNYDALKKAAPDIRQPVLDTPLPWTSRDKMLSPHSRQRSKGPLEIVICGYLNSPNRRLFETLDALASFGRKDELFLHIAGRVKDEKALVDKIEKLGLAGLVKLHGYLSDESLDGLLSRVDLAVNLRWPTMGEASGSQLRFWDHSLPTIATNTGWYSCQTEGCLLLVDPSGEEADLHKYWNLALDDYGMVNAVGLKGREVLKERHSAEVFAKALESFVKPVGEYGEKAFSQALAARTGRALGRTGLPKKEAQLAALSAARALAGIAGLSEE
jgi:glycosyltransferase involved in cell wall biosynthesis